VAIRKCDGGRTRIMTAPITGRPTRGQAMWDIITIVAIVSVLFLGREAQTVFAKARASGWNDFPRR